MSGSSSSRMKEEDCPVREEEELVLPLMARKWAQGMPHQTGTDLLARPHFLTPQIMP